MPAQLSQLIFPVALLAAFWFLIIRPQQQRAKAAAEMLSRLEEGAEVLTIGGIYGTIVDLGEDRLRIAVADGSELEIVRRAVQTVVTPAAETLPEAQDDDEPEPPVAQEGEGDA